MFGLPPVNCFDNPTGCHSFEIGGQDYFFGGYNGGNNIITQVANETLITPIPIANNNTSIDSALQNINNSIAKDSNNSQTASEQPKTINPYILAGVIGLGLYVILK